MNTSRQVCLYLFEPHTIQPYIFETGRLAEMVGASELLEDLLGRPLNDTLKAVCPAVSEDDFLRKGGASFIVMMEDRAQAERLRDIWGLVVARNAPGLKFGHCVAEASSVPKALEQGRQRLQELRNISRPELPAAGPLVIRAPRTGRPAVKLKEVKKKRQEWLDQDTLKKRGHRKGKSLAGRFFHDPDLALNEFAFPLNMEQDEANAFPFASDNRYVAVVHIDGNGLGEILLELGRKLAGQQDDRQAADIFRHFSRSLQEATETAARRALSDTILQDPLCADLPVGSDGKKRLPFRPLVLGGDDLTAIVRADFALDFSRSFIGHFEEESAARLESIGSGQVPRTLTGCGGIAFVKAHQPFRLAYDLAESLCSYAKDAARRHRKQGEPIPSCLAMHRVTTSFITDYATAREEEMRRQAAAAARYFTLGVYGAGRHAQDFPPLEALIGLKELFREPEMARGPLRHYLTLAHVSPGDAKHHYQRWLRNLKKRFPVHYTRYLDLADRLIPGCGTSDLPMRTSGSREAPVEETFIGDLTHLLAVEGEAHDR